jgi:uncharacterized GH25 family protein
MTSRLFVAVTLALLSAASPAFAHFVWVAVEKDSAGQPAAHVWFSELAEPDSADLLDKIVTVKVWSRLAAGKPMDVKVTKQTLNGGGGALTGPVPAGTPALSAHINYGVLTRREQTFLLHYHAKYLDAAAAEFKTLVRDPALSFEIVPHRNEKDFTLEVLFRGKPVAGSEVVILDPAANETQAKTDDAGRVQLPATRPGLYSIRAKWVVMEAGKQGDKEYPQVNHYSTLALRVPGASVGGVAKEATGLAAADLLNQARDGRAVWRNFPGFEADLVLFAEGREHKGRIHVAADGQVTLHGLELKDEKPLLGTLRSLVGHRLSSGEGDDHGSFADAQTDHPLGRLIKLDSGSAMASTYRVKGDVIHEVNRQGENGRFTITVFDVHRNPEGKHLPGYYTVSYWNKDGSLKSSSVIRESWTRVGHLDLPAKYDAVYTGSSEHRNLSMVFSNHKLLK